MSFEESLGICLMFTVFVGLIVSIHWYEKRNKD